MSDHRPGTVLLVGNLLSETVLSTLKNQGRPYKEKRLLSKPDNWLQAAASVTEAHIAAVLVKFTEYTLFLAALPEYRIAFERLVSAVETKPHLALIYRDNLAGEFSASQQISFDSYERGWTFEKWYEEHHVKNKRHHAAAMQAAVARLRTGLVRLAPYRTRSELLLAAQAFLNDFDRGLLLRLYVPHGRLWANELDKLLVLFRDYLKRVVAEDINLDQHRTDHGTIYAFYSPAGKISDSDLSKRIGDFGAFLNLCVDSPDKARDLLHKSRAAGGDLGRLIDRYAREARRIFLDAEYEREARLLSIRHKLHAELLDVMSSSELTELTQDVVRVAAQAKIEAENLLSTARQVPASLTINIQPQYVSKVEGVVAQEILGNVEYGQHEQKLLALVEKYVADREEAIRLSSAVNELKDRSAPKEVRLSAWQRLQVFVLKVAPHIGKRALDILQKYLEVQIGL